MKSNLTRTLVFYLGFLCLSCCGVRGFAQPGNQLRGLLEHPKWVHFLQGEELRITKDFVARLDGDRLRVALIDNGLISSVAPQDLAVTLIQADEAPQEKRPNANGELVFEGVKTGLSALLVMGSETATVASTATYTAFAFFAHASEGIAVAGEDAEGSPTLEVPMGTVEPESLLASLEEVESSDRTDEIVPIADSQFDPATRFRVVRQADGSLAGRVIVPQQEFEQPGPVRITFTHDDVVVAQTVSSQDGRFQVPDMDLGFYSVHAAGVPGHANFSFELVASNAQDFELPVSWNSVPEGANTRFVAKRISGAKELTILLIPQALMEDVLTVVRDRFQLIDDPAGAADGLASSPLAGEAGAAGSGGLATAGGASGMAGGGFGGGGFGGSGGGFGGGGGAAGFLGIAGLAVAATALADDDDGFNTNLATPIVQGP